MNLSNFLPVGSHLCRQPAPPMAELKRDMETLRRNGFNMVKIQTHWMIDEPVEGRVDTSFAGELAAHAARLDMGVYVSLTCEQAPHWVYAKHPDCRPVLRDGRATPYESPTTLPADGKPGPCFDHPGVRADQLRYVRAQTAALAPHENVVVWNVWQEIGYWSAALLGGDTCFCPHTAAFFHEWLREKFGGDIGRLNEAWRTRYPAFEDVQADRLRTPQPSVQDMEWRWFMDNVQPARVLRERAAAVRAADPAKRPVFAHKGCEGVGPGQNWAYAREVDFLGASCYPAWGCLHPWDDHSARPFQRHEALLAETWDRVALCYDYVRSANPPGRPVWAAELQGGPVSTGLHFGRVPDAADIRRWMFTALGSGVTAFSFWVTRAEIMAMENNGFSLLDGEGDATERLGEAGRVARALAAQGGLFKDPTLPRAPAAILVNERNNLYTAALGGAEGHAQYATRGWYKRFWDDGVPVDFMEVGELEEAYGRAVKLLVVPFPISLSDAEVAKLAAFAEQSGHVLVEAMAGRLDEYGFCPRAGMSPALASLLDARHESLTLVREPLNGGEPRWSPPERTWGEYAEPLFLTGAGPLAGCRLRAHFYLQTVKPGGGAHVETDPILFTPDGRAAGLRRRMGKGAFWWIGTFVGHGGTAYRDAESDACVRAVRAAAGVVSDACGRLLRRRRVLPEREAWIFTNPAPETVTERVSLESFTSAFDLLGEPLPVFENHATVAVPPLDARIMVVEKRRE